MNDPIRLASLPSHVKWFVGLITALMVGVVLWAAFIYTVEKGLIGGSDDLPEYLSAEQQARIRQSVTPGHEEATEPEDDDEPDLEHNVGLAHTHINGQTLLFFALGTIFMFSSATPRLKRNLSLLFAASIVAHAVGLSGQDFHWWFDDLLAVSGVAILVLMLYMAYRIFVDLGRNGTTVKS